MREKGRDRREPIVEGEERAEYSQGAGKARCARREQQLLLKKKKGEETGIDSYSEQGSQRREWLERGKSDHAMEH